MHSKKSWFGEGGWGKPLAGNTRWSAAVPWMGLGARVERTPAPIAVSAYCIALEEVIGAEVRTLASARRFLLFGKPRD
jgi:hypothetical protein